jgi:uncharacterized membrane protein
MDLARNEKPNRADRIAAVVAVLPLLAVAALLAPRDRTFLSHVIFFCAPHACALASLYLMFEPPRAAIAAGVGLAMAAYLAGYGAWVNLSHEPAPAAWVNYYFAVPGAVLGAVVAAVWPGERREQPPVTAAVTAAAVVTVGALASLTALGIVFR